MEVDRSEGADLPYALTTMDQAIPLRPRSQIRAGPV